ncbi:MAG: HEPN domain-containing protein [Magnetococcales bacterium]|nr:HEPN domain-containing protein [Magnetococcales bacterium]
MNVEQQVTYWRTGSDEDWDMVEIALEKGKIRHGLFFLHLAIEKLLKAHICRVTGGYPPKIHDLIRLTKQAELDVSEAWLLLLGRMNAFCLIGRYPGNPTAQNISIDVAYRYLHDAQEVRAWLQQTLFSP